MPMKAPTAALTSRAGKLATDTLGALRAEAERELDRPASRMPREAATTSDDAAMSAKRSPPQGGGLEAESTQHGRGALQAGTARRRHTQQGVSNDARHGASGHKGKARLDKTYPRLWGEGNTRRTNLMLAAGLSIRRRFCPLRAEDRINALLQVVRLWRQSPICLPRSRKHRFLRWRPNPSHRFFIVLTAAFVSSAPLCITDDLERRPRCLGALLRVFALLESTPTCGHRLW